MTEDEVSKPVGFRSKAQRRRFLELLNRGVITQETFDQWDKASEFVLPEKAPYKPKGLIRKPRRVR